MRILFAFLLTVLTQSGARAADDFAGAWLLRQTPGLMGMALQIESGRFKYWFYSDVPPPHPISYPIVGSVSVENGVLRLTPDNGEQLYDTAWRKLSYQGDSCLIAGHDDAEYRRSGKAQAATLLCSFRGFDERWPRLNWRKSP